MKQGRIVKVSGPLVVADGMEEAHMADVVRVGEEGLIGEILNMTAARASIQVYEDTSMLMPGAAVESTGAPLSAELGPGLLGMIYDGIQRPLPVLLERSGGNLARGVRVSALPREKKWHFVPAVQKGQTVQPGDVLGTVQETAAVEHRILTPVGLSGTVDAIVREGAYTVDEVIAVIDDGARREVTMVQRWPVTMIVSENTAQLDTRFGTAKERLSQLERLTGKPVMTTLQEAERTGPIDHFDAMVIAPMTATELNKLALGIYDTPVTLAAKALLRNEKPLVLGIASNDFLGLSGANLLRLKQVRHLFFVPFGQDDYVRKPNSLVSDWRLIEATLQAALEDRQIQPLLLEGKGSQ